jgi:predicted ribonuclease YlaK
VGNNSRIFWDGSLQQIDSELFKNRNGLRSLLKLADSPYADMFSVVRLNKIERSKTAQIADYLDEIGGF